jgi:hypothetical protein
VLQTKANLVTTLMTDLATANHISVCATTYGADGTHLVHRNGGGHDGAIVRSRSPHTSACSASRPRCSDTINS